MTEHARHLESRLLAQALLYTIGITLAAGYWLERLIRRLDP